MHSILRSYKHKQEKRRFLLLFSTILIALQTLGCTKSGKGAYLVVSQGAYPSSDAAYLVDTSRGSIDLLCAKNSRAYPDCSMAVSSYNLDTLAIVSPSESEDISNNRGIRLFVHGRRIDLPPLMDCMDCSPIDMSITPNSSELIVVMFSRSRKASSVWSLNITQKLWKQLGEWNSLPNWFTRPLSDPTGRYVYFLSVDRKNKILSSELRLLDRITGKVENLPFRRQVATFAMGGPRQIAMWTENGLETCDHNGTLKLLAPTSILSQSEIVKPNGLAWDDKYNVIALGTYNRATKRTRIIEIDSLTGKANTVFDRKLGEEVSIQAIGPRS